MRACMTEISVTNASSYAIGSCYIRTHTPSNKTNDDATVCDQINDPLVALGVPWLELMEGRDTLLGEKFAFETQGEQEALQ